MPSVTDPTKLPKPLTAELAPNAAIPSAIAAMPLPAEINLAPSNSSKLFMPSAIVGSAFPTIHVAPAIAPPINKIVAPNDAAPATTAGLANAEIPFANPPSIPPRPLPIPLPILAMPLPGLLLLPGILLLLPTESATLVSPDENGFNLPARPAMPLPIAPTTALAANNPSIPPISAPITPLFSHIPAKPSPIIPIIALTHSPFDIFSPKALIDSATPTSMSAKEVNPDAINDSTPESTNAFCNAPLT